MSKVKSTRLPDDLAAWVESYAKERGVPEGSILATAAESLREDAKSGVPDIREAAKRQAVSSPATTETGVGDCPEREEGLGHVWATWMEDLAKPCRFCGKSGREFFQEFTQERPEFFSKLRQPESAKKWGRSE